MRRELAAAREGAGRSLARREEAWGAGEPSSNGCGISSAAGVCGARGGGGACGSGRGSAGRAGGGSGGYGYGGSDGGSRAHPNPPTAPGAWRQVALCDMDVIGLAGAALWQTVPLAVRGTTACELLMPWLATRAVLPGCGVPGGGAAGCGGDTAHVAGGEPLPDATCTGGRAGGGAGV